MDEDKVGLFSEIQCIMIQHVRRLRGKVTTAMRMRTVVSGR